MSPRERVRRLVDGELDPTEQAALWADAERDEALAEALEEATVLSEALADFADDAPEPPPDLVDGAVLRAVQERDALERQPSWKKAWRALSRPFVLRLRVTPTSALVAVTAVALIGVYAYRGGWIPGGIPEAAPIDGASHAATRRASKGPAPTTPPAQEMAADDEQSMVEVAVRLMFPAEDASTVAVAGDFNGWATDATYLEDPEGDGVFTGTVRLPPGSYAYMFVVDGERWETDPTAVNHRDDGFGHRNAVLRID